MWYSGLAITPGGAPHLGSPGPEGKARFEPSLPLPPDRRGAREAPGNGRAAASKPEKGENPTRGKMG